MPPKKDQEEPESEDGFDAIADATSKILNDGENSPSRKSSSANSKNSTKTQKHESGNAGPENNSGETNDDPTTQDQDDEIDKDRLPGPYVPTDLSYALQEAQIQLRRMTGEKISQSLIIECALEICLRDFNERGSESGIAKLVRKKYYQQKQK